MMSSNNASPTNAFAGSIPENYDRYLGPLLFEPYALDLAARIDPQQAGSVLEIACGTGRVTKHLKKRLAPGARLVATDLNPDMINVAKAALDDNTIMWQTADAQALPFPDKTFDLVVCQFGVMFVPDKPKAFAEAFRVLKNGGIFLFNTWDKVQSNSFMHTGIEVMAGLMTDKPPVFFQVPFSMHDEPKLVALCTNAGFTNIVIELVKKDSGSSNARDFALGMVKGNPVYNEIKILGEQKVAEVIDAIEKATISKHGPGIQKETLQAFVCRAEKP